MLLAYVQQKVSKLCIFRSIVSLQKYFNIDFSDVKYLQLNFGLFKPKHTEQNSVDVEKERDEEETF